MNNATRPTKGTRVQTTVSVLAESVEALDLMAAASGVSRSRLIDLAIRRFSRWAAQLDPADLALIADYEVAEPISGFMRRPTPQPMAAVTQAVVETLPAPPETPRPKVLSSSAPRQRDGQGRYVTEAPPPARRTPRGGNVPTT